jgi:formylglycine-generating enzyme required for sulfatase activity
LPRGAYPDDGEPACQVEVSPLWIDAYAVPNDRFAAFQAVRVLR